MIGSMANDKNYDRSGIYRITRIENGDTYVGSSAYIKVRWRQHRSLLRKGKHHSPHLQNSWTKCGEDAFEFVIVEECEVDDLLAREQYHLDALAACFNVAKIAGSRRGVPQSEASREKSRQASLGHVVSPEARARIAASAMGNTRGLGMVHTPEARAKMSAAMKGTTGSVGRVWTEESRAKNSASQKGRVLTPEHREKLRLAWIVRRAREAGP